MNPLSGYLVVALCGLVIETLRAEEDWIQIGTETDEPAIGGLIESVIPDRIGEKIGLEAGDFILTRNDCYFSIKRARITEPYRIEKEIYYRVSFQASGMEMNTKWVPKVSATISKHAGSKVEIAKLVNRAFAAASLVTKAPMGKKTSTLTTETQGGAVELPSPYSIPFRNEIGDTVVEPGKEVSAFSENFTFELIKTKKESAVFVNGVCYSHFSNVDNKDEILINFFLSGSMVRIADFEVWSLDSDGKY